MKGHNYGLCKKCNLIHVHPKGMLNKNHSFKTKNKMNGRKAWNKELNHDEYESHYKNGFGGYKNKGKMIGNKNPSKRKTVREKISKYWKGKKKTEIQKEKISITKTKTGIGNYRKKAYKNFKLECSLCKKNKIIYVHHKDKNRYNNNLNNLEILCPKCHNDKHKIDRFIGRTKFD